MANVTTYSNTSRQGVAGGSARSPLCIGIVTETFPPEINGVAHTVSNLAQQLIEKGYRVQLVCPQRDDRDPRQVHSSMDVISVPGLPIPHYDSLRFGLPAAGMLRKIWYQHRPHAVYVATEGPLGWSAIRVATSYGIPVISGFHTNFHTYSRHYKLGWMESVVVRYLKYFHNKAGCSLVPTVEMKNTLEKMGIRRVQVVSRGVDTGLFTPSRRSNALRQSWGLLDQDLAVLYVGRLAPEKNLALAVEAFLAILAFHPRAKFILVGDGPMARGLRKKYPEFVFAGVKRGVCLAEHYASCDMFLFPSTSETYGNVVPEAMASGLGVVAYSYAAAALHIQHNVRGMLAAKDDENQFIERAVSLATSPVTLRRMRTNAHSYARSLTWGAVCEKFERVIIQQLGNNAV